MIVQHSYSTFAVILFEVLKLQIGLYTCPTSKIPALHSFPGSCYLVCCLFTTAQPYQILKPLILCFLILPTVCHRLVPFWVLIIHNIFSILLPQAKTASHLQFHGAAESIQQPMLDLFIAQLLSASMQTPCCFAKLVGVSSGSSLSHVNVSRKYHQLRLLQTENTRITDGEGTSGGTNDRNGVGGKHAGGNGAFKVFDEMPDTETKIKPRRVGLIKEYYDVEADVGYGIQNDSVNGMLNIPLRVMGIRVNESDDDKGVEDICEENVEGNELGSNESSEVEVNEVVIVDEPMKGEVKNKSEDGLLTMVGGTQTPGKKQDLSMGFDKHRVGDREDEDMESIGVISNNFKGMWEDSEKMIILLIHMVWFMGRQQRLKIPFGKNMENKFEMVFKLLLEFASNIHRVHDINDTRLREIDAKIGDLGLEKRLKLVLDSWVFGLVLLWIRNIVKSLFDVQRMKISLSTNSAD
ncbi:hypothetical protein Tco_1311288 [Tanacetum coccineum]